MEKAWEPANCISFCHQMSFCLTELHLWSLKNTLHVGDEDIGTYQYYDKKELASQTNYGYLEEKRQLAESRDYPWILKNRRPEKLRDTLSELEELMQNSECVLSKWKNKYVCQLLYGSGVLVSLSLSGPHLEKVVIDKTLMGKLISDSISDAALMDSFIILSFWDKNKLCYIQFTKADSPDTNKRLEKLSSLDFKISHVDLPGPAGRQMRRRLAVNCMQDMVICWWLRANDDAWPWSPISTEREKANLVLLSCANSRLEVLSYIRTEWDPLDASFSINQPYQVHTVEQSISADKEPMADSCIYECARSKIQCVAVTRIPLRSNIISCCRNSKEDKLVLGCEDSSVILYEGHHKMTLLAQAELLPTLIQWHPSGSLFLVGSSQGELQIFDMALSPVKVQLLAEDCSPVSTLQFCKHFDVSSSMVQMQWTVPQGVPQNADSSDIYNLLFLRFDKGPIGVLLFKFAQLEASLGTFYAPVRLLSDTTVLEYRDPISRYARRFFHHLLRYQRFEKAFLLAVDIGARDLFMDIHYIALDKSELALAEVAKRKANEIDAESITTGVELLESLDQVDTLSEAFVDLSMTPHGEESFLDGSHPSGLNGRCFSQCAAHDSSFNRPSNHRQTSDLERELGINIYASPLMDKTLPWNQEGNLEEDGEQDSGGNGSLKVIHFGLV
uniref:WD repeat-containing and planar cell polarity effector protein fritz homolog isoform X3 n=1 Tax=Geotrypetes seraphini TaxID=260995 RepID=A0A6P8QFR9_GEOSA|nr:WD repeat-containing and planar cell polarity effector protein fritz homolog isoform X3 [Geotrypetes seraphini]